LGREKGYRLVGVQRLGFNAFFVREDIGAQLLPEITPAHVYAWAGSMDWSPNLEAITGGPEPWERV
jgi:hypothetical protein